MKLLKTLFGKRAPEPVAEETPLNSAHNVDIFDHQLNAWLGQTTGQIGIPSIFDGEKFPGGLGPIQLIFKDYWALRERSSEIFDTNLYGRGLINRLVTNEINTGLTPDAFPAEEILSVPENSLDDWGQDVVKRFEIYGKNERVCDFKRADTLGKIQDRVRREALIEGDILVILRQNSVTKVPNIELVRGANVRTPTVDNMQLRRGHEIREGVEFDAAGRQVAFWVTANFDKPRRVPAFGEKSGRRIAWLVYGSNKRVDEVRGMPLLGVVLQSLKEIDRYRDSAQRKAVINSFLAMYVKKGEKQMGSLPVSGAAVKKSEVTFDNDQNGSARTVQFASGMPGVQLEEMGHGEEIELLGGQGTDVNFEPFERAVVQAIAWCNEIPPEILTLAFSNNYSASAAAINEFKIYLNKFWAHFGESFCQPIYIEWLISEVLAGRIQADGLLDAWRDPAQFEIFGAWTLTAWYGSIKPSTDMAKTVKASRELIAEGLSTRTREARTTTGTSFKQNVKRLRRENAALAEARLPLFENADSSMGAEAPNQISAIADRVEMVQDYIEDRANG